MIGVIITFNKKGKNEQIPLNKKGKKKNEEIISYKNFMLMHKTPVKSELNLNFKTKKGIIFYDCPPSEGDIFFFLLNT